MLKIAITGSEGFIGHNLCNYLEQKYDLIKIDKKNGIDILNIKRLDSKIDKTCSAILHHAAKISAEESVINPLDTLNTNIVGTLNVLEIARKKDIPKVIIASSAAVYGNTQKKAKESDKLNPSNPYGTSKVINEINALEYSKLYGITTIILRYFNVYGKYQNPKNPYSGVISKFLDYAKNNCDIPIFGDGTQTRDFVNVRQIIEANRIAIEKLSKSEIYNVCTGRETSINTLAKVIIKLTKSNSKIVYREKREGDIYKSVGNPEKLRKIGVKIIRLEEGLKEMI
ncbi:MAG: NAD-dependent epimerase/dehydratase family protein [Candidatus Micrarchaeia archaeon]